MNTAATTSGDLADNRVHGLANMPAHDEAAPEEGYAAIRQGDVHQQAAAYFAVNTANAFTAEIRGQLHASVDVGECVPLRTKPLYTESREVKPSLRFSMEDDVTKEQIRHTYELVQSAILHLMDEIFPVVAKHDRMSAMAVIRSEIGEVEADIVQGVFEQVAEYDLPSTVRLLQGRIDDDAVSAVEQVLGRNRKADLQQRADLVRRRIGNEVTAALVDCILRRCEMEKLSFITQMNLDIMAVVKNVIIIWLQGIESDPATAMEILQMDERNQTGYTYGDSEVLANIELQKAFAKMELPKQAFANRPEVRIPTVTAVLNRRITEHRMNGIAKELREMKGTHIRGIEVETVNTLALAADLRDEHQELNMAVPILHAILTMDQRQDPIEYRKIRECIKGRGTFIMNYSAAFLRKRIADSWDKQTRRGHWVIVRSKMTSGPANTIVYGGSAMTHIPDDDKNAELYFLFARATGPLALQADKAPLLDYTASRSEEGFLTVDVAQRIKHDFLDAHGYFDRYEEGKQIAKLIQDNHGLAGCMADLAGRIPRMGFAGTARHGVMQIIENDINPGRVNKINYVIAELVRIVGLVMPAAKSASGKHRLIRLTHPIENIATEGAHYKSKRHRADLLWTRHDLEPVEDPKTGEIHWFIVEWRAAGHPVYPALQLPSTDQSSDERGIFPRTSSSLS